MKLTENEIRDVIKYLEAGKSLPDKYRFMLFDDVREVELLWNGKSNEVTNTILPFQTIEHIDEPREEHIAKLQTDMFSQGGRQISDWTNKLIWGDNKLILSSLKNGPLREEIEKQGGIKLIYIDPPFDVGADFSMDIQIGEESFTKQPSVLEELAYRDTWGRGTDSFIAMIYERIRLMSELLSEDGSIFVHCDYRVSSNIKAVLDEVLGPEHFVNEIIWKRSANTSSIGKILKRAHDTIYYYSKTDKYKFNFLRKPLSEESLKIYSKHDDRGRYRVVPLLVSGRRAGQTGTPWRGVDPNRRGQNGMHWVTTHEKLDAYEKQGLIVWPQKEGSVPGLKYYLEDNPGVVLSDLWDDIAPTGAARSESVDYPTQKPEALLERIIKTASDDGDLVSDFFMGSGTTLAVAEKLGRKWIGSDMGKFSVHTARKRMIDVQRKHKAENKNYRAFEILNLGRYERQHYVGVNTNLRHEEQEAQLAKKEKDFVTLISKAYKAETVEGFKTFQAKRASRLVAIGPINLPVSTLYAKEVVDEAISKGITKIDILAFEFEMGLSPAAQDEAKARGVDLALKYIPREVFDKRAIEKDQVVFHDVSFIEVKPHVKGKTLAIELTDFSVFYSQANIDQVSAELKPGGSKVEVIDGQIWKIWKDKNTDIVERDQLTKNWTDWVDYWSVDFNYESKKEVLQSVDGEATWTGDYIFENDWQSFRTKKDRKLELQSVFNEYPSKGHYKVAIKVIDIFGNDTTKVIEVSI